MNFKMFLTRSGLLVTSNDVVAIAFFTDNMATFRRVASIEEATHLIENELVHPASSSSLKYQLSSLTAAVAAGQYDWHYLWTTVQEDYSSYKEGTCRNGGDYAYYGNHHYFGRVNPMTGMSQFIKWIEEDTSSGIPYTSDGDFTEEVIADTIIGISGDREWKYLKQFGGDHGYLTLEQIGVPTELREALYSTGATHAPKDREQEYLKGWQEKNLSLKEFLHRCKVLKKELGILPSEFSPRHHRHRR